MRNDNFTMQDSQFDTQNDMQGMNTPNPMPKEELKCVAEGIDSYYYAFLFSLLLPIILIVVNFIIAATTFSNGDIDTYFISGLIVDGIITIALLGPHFTNAFSNFCKTPEEIFPNARRAIVSSVIFWILSFVGGLLTVFVVPEDTDPSILFTIALVLNGMFLYSYYRFYSFLSVVGEKTTPSKKGCKLAMVLLVISYVLFAMSLYSCHFLEPDNIDPEEIMSLSSILPSNGWFYGSYIVYCCGAIALLTHVSNLRDYFQEIKLLEKETPSETKTTSWDKSNSSFNSDSSDNSNNSANCNSSDNSDGTMGWPTMIIVAIWLLVRMMNG